MIVQVQRMKLQLAVVPFCNTQVNGFVYSGRQYKTVVVIRMLPYQVNTSAARTSKGAVLKFSLQKAQ